MQYRILAATNFIFYMQFQQLLRQGILWRGLYLITLFALNIVLSRLLQAEVSGWANYLTTIFFLVTIVVSLNIESGVAYYVASKLMLRQTVVSFVVLAFGIVTLLTSIGMFACANYLPQTNASNTMVALLGIAFVLGTLLSNIFLGLFQAEDDFLSGNAMMACVNVVLIAVLLLLYWQGTSKKQLVLTYFSFFTIQGLAVAVFYFFKQKPITRLHLPNKQQLSLLLRYSLLALAGNVVFFFVYRVDFWFVNRYCTATDLGNYIQASKTVQLLLVVPQILASVVFPKSAVSGNLSFIPQQILIISRLLIQCFLVVIVGSICFGKILFTSVFGDSFNTMHLSFTWLLPGILGLSILAILSAYFSGLNQIKVNITGALLALVVILIGDILFVKQYGIVGAAVVSSVGYMVNVVYSFYHFFKQNNLRVTALLSFEKADYDWLKSLLTNKAA